MMAIMFLPRQFQMAAVENYDESHINKAPWLFPLYLFLINIFALPIAFGRLLLEGSEKMADYFVLTLPLNHGERYLSLLALIGGFSAATGNGHSGIISPKHYGAERYDIQACSFHNAVYDAFITAQIFQKDF